MVADFQSNLGDVELIVRKKLGGFFDPEGAEVKRERLSGFLFY